MIIQHSGTWQTSAMSCYVFMCLISVGLTGRNFKANHWGRSGRPDQVIAELIDQLHINVIGMTRLPATYEQTHLSHLQKNYPDKNWIVEESFTLFRQDQLPFNLANLPNNFTEFRKAVENIPAKPSLVAPASLPRAIKIGFDEENLNYEQNTDAKMMPFTGGEMAGILQLNYYLQETRLLVAAQSVK